MFVVGEMTESLGAGGVPQREPRPGVAETAWPRLPRRGLPGPGWASV